METEKTNYKVSRLIGDRIKMDVLLLLRYPCRNTPSNIGIHLDCEKTKRLAFGPSYSILRDCIPASSSVLLKKLNEMQKDHLIYSEKKSKMHNKRIFWLEPLGKKVADLLLEIEKSIEEGVPKDYRADWENEILGKKSE